MEMKGAEQTYETLKKAVCFKTAFGILIAELFEQGS